MPSAQVTVVERLEEFKIALLIFADKGKDAMSGNAMEIRRSLDWLEAQLAIWKSVIRKAEEDVVHAKNALSRKKMMRISDRPPDTTDEEKALRKAQAWLAFAEGKRDHTTRWIRKLPDDVEEYNGQARPFQETLEHDLVKMIAFLQAKIVALDEYHRIQSTGETP
jgi:hypothetical protein